LLKVPGKAFQLIAEVEVWTFVLEAFAFEQLLDLVAFIAIAPFHDK
jgi:hypothetical protein